MKRTALRRASTGERKASAGSKAGRSGSSQRVNPTAAEPAQAFFRLLVHPTRASDFKAATGSGRPSNRQQKGQGPPPSGLAQSSIPGCPPAVKREARGGVMTAMNGRDLFAQADQQVSALKERLARQHEVIKRAQATRPLHSSG